MLSNFFIRRPIFAWVVAILIMLAGGLGILTLPIAQYPSIAPPAVQISATYPGASAATLESSVTQVIEQQLKGLDHLLYFSANSSSNGQVQITATFETGTNSDTARVQVQNKVAQATPLLPSEVQAQGVTVLKSQASFLLIVAVSDPTEKLSSTDLGDFVNSSMVDPLSRVSGVGDIQSFGSQYAIRIWLDPNKLNTFKLTASDVRTAITDQNVQVSGGQVGALPAVQGQQLNANVNIRSRLSTPAQFRAIVLKSESSGALVTLADVARVEMGADTYDIAARLNGHPAAGFAIKLAPGADALKTVEAAKARATALKPLFPPNVVLSFPVDNSTFVRISIEDVIKTLIEAIALVVVVMFVFLQNWRATLIPAIAVPVVLLGTFAILAVAGMSINTLTLFALVLAIGLLVDDAIVVVENVERILDEEPDIAPQDATIKSMAEISPVLIGITVVLIAVFLPMAFFGGSTGVIYRQFAISMIAAMSLSLIVALVLTPALCATLLKRREREDPAKQRGFFGWFNRSFTSSVKKYDGVLERLLKHRWPVMIVYALIAALMLGLFLRMPGGFLPEEDQGSAIAQYTLPPGAAAGRTDAISREVEHHFLVDEKANVEDLFIINGYNFGGVGQNAGTAFVKFKDWADRKGSNNRAPAIVGRATGAFSQIRDAQVFAFVPPAVQELGNANGFDLELTDTGNVGHEKLTAARNQLLGMAAQSKKLFGVRPNGQEDSPQLDVTVDAPRAGALGLSESDVNDTLSTAFGSTYLNQFADRGRVKNVYMQGDAQFRMSPNDLEQWHVRTNQSVMAPVSAFATVGWSFGPTRLERYNGQSSIEILGQAATGQSSGEALAEIVALAGKLPPGIGHELTGLSYQEQLAGSQGTQLYALALVVVFLCLAALYESWVIPVAVLMVVPLGVVGAVILSTLRGFDNDIYFQVGLLTTIGLACKNAILIIEYAIAAEAEGKTPVEAALQAANLRLRPILMTSLAFIAGCIPLMLANGAGSGSQTAIGTAVVGGMFAATILAIFFVPVFFVLIRALVKNRAKPADDKRPADPAQPAPEGA